MMMETEDLGLVQRYCSHGDVINGAMLEMYLIHL